MFSRLLSPFVLLASTAALPGQMVTLIAQALSGPGPAGTICAPLTCVPDPLSLPSRSTVQVQIGGRAPWLLLIAPPPAGCINVPGIGGALIAQQPLLLPFEPFGMVHHYISQGPGQPPPVCTAITYVSNVKLPPLPRGTQFILQAFALDEFQPGKVPGLSNAILVTIV